jgi:GT2 family glycosyltransferase
VNRSGTGLVIVTVAYDSQEPLERLAADVARQTRGPERWLVVDNAPRSAPLRICGALQEAGPERIAGNEGAGFGEGCNQAFERLAADRWTGWVWLLNPDATLPETTVLERFTSILATLPDRALVGTAVWSSEGNLEASGGWIDPGLTFRRRRLTPSHLAAANPTPLALDWLSGCSLALRPSAHAPAARFDPALPLYYEDMDLCLRLGAFGAKALWTSAVAIAHQRGNGSGGDPDRRARLTTISYWRFLQRHRPLRERVLRGTRLVGKALIRLPGHTRSSLAVLRGLVAAMRNPIDRHPS